MYGLGASRHGAPGTLDHKSRRAGAGAAATAARTGGAQGGGAGRRRLHFGDLFPRAFSCTSRGRAGSRRGGGVDGQQQRRRQQRQRQRQQASTCRTSRSSRAHASCCRSCFFSPTWRKQAEADKSTQASTRRCQLRAGGTRSSSRVPRSQGAAACLSSRGECRILHAGTFTVDDCCRSGEGGVGGGLEHLACIRRRQTSRQLAIHRRHAAAGEPRQRRGAAHAHAECRSEGGAAKGVELHIQHAGTGEQRGQRRRGWSLGGATARGALQHP